MNSTALFIAASTLGLALGLVTWAWFAMARVEEELRSFSGFEAMHFEIGPQAAEDSERTRWPIPR